MYVIHIKVKTECYTGKKAIVTPGTENNLTNVSARLEKFSEQAVVARVHLVGAHRLQLLERISLVSLIPISYN